MNTIVCPSCKSPVEISEALTHQLKDQIEKTITSEHEKKLAQMKLEYEEKSKKKLEEEIAFKLKESATEIEEKNKKNREMQEQLLLLTKQLREMKERDDSRELEMQKQLLQERQKLQEEIGKSEKEKASLEKMELVKQLEDTKKALEDAQRKAAQKSQQLQGEVLELNLENQLIECFPNDEILPVPKGIEGADIWQKVRNKYGQVAGSILWETKRTKAWSNAWTAKLRDNARQVGASDVILVSEVLPDGITTFGRYENVWVANYAYAVPVAELLRFTLMQVAIAKSAAANKDEKLESLYAYLTDNTFKHRFEAQVESILELKNDLESEQRSTVRVWKKREMQINRMRNNIASMYGELQGILGSALPSLPSLDGPQLLETSANGVKQDGLLD